MFDLEDPAETLYPTNFDLIRIKDLEIGEKLEAESGAWIVYRYKSDYTLIIGDNYSRKHRISPLNCFKSLEKLISFLQHH